MAIILRQVYYTVFIIRALIQQGSAWVRYIRFRLVSRCEAGCDWFYAVLPPADTRDGPFLQDVQRTVDFAPCTIGVPVFRIDILAHEHLSRRSSPLPYTLPCAVVH